MMSHEIVTEERIFCDLCHQYAGEMTGMDSGRMGDPGSTWRVNIERRACGHDICGTCWWYPGDMHHCPICVTHCEECRPTSPLRKKRYDEFGEI